MIVGGYHRKGHLKRSIMVPYEDRKKCDRTMDYSPCVLVKIRKF